MRCYRRCFCVFALVLWACPAALAQEHPCTVPVNVLTPNLSGFPKALGRAAVSKLESLSRESKGATRGKNSEVLNFVVGGTNPVTFPSWSVVRDLSAGAFIAQRGGTPLVIRSVTTNQAPRRIVFVAEDSRKMTTAARRIEATIISEVLARARPEDSFALLTAGPAPAGLHFGASRKSIREAVEELRKLPQASSGRGPKKRSVLDALMEAVTWLQPRRQGDAIFLLARQVEGRSHYSFSKVRAAVAAAGIRVFAFQLGPRWAFLFGQPEVIWRYEALTLSSEGGGVAVLADTERPEYHLTEARLHQLVGDADQMYRAITEYYVLAVGYVGPKLSVALSASARKRFPVAMVLYPWYAPTCSDGPPTRTGSPR